jgi:hypothetical protein
MAEQRRQPRRNRRQRGARLQSADHAQPRGRAPAQQRVAANQHGLLMQRYPQVGRIAAQRLARKCWRPDAYDGDRTTIHNEHRAHHAGIRSVLLLPGAIAHHRRRRCAVLVVGGHKRSPCRRADAEGRKVIPAYILAMQRFGEAIGLRAAHAQHHAARLKCGQLLELRSVLFDLLIEGIGEHAPVVLRSALNAAVVTRADAIEAARIVHRQGLQHDRVDERKNRGGCTNANGQRQQSSQRKYRRQPQLTQSVNQVLTKGLDVVPLFPELEDLLPSF